VLHRAFSAEFVESHFRLHPNNFGSFEKFFILEIKSAATLTRAHASHDLHYLTATGSRLALLLNFGQAVLKFKRSIR
jgi:hypothetical protein